MASGKTDSALVIIEIPAAARKRETVVKTEEATVIKETQGRREFLILKISIIEPLLSI